MDALVDIKPIRRESRRLGYVEDPDTFFAEEKARIWAKLGDISGIRLPFNRILVAIWAPDTDRKTGSIILPDKVAEEDKWQGSTGLVVKMGARCYEDSDQLKFLETDKCHVNDWVLIRKGDGFTMELWWCHCVELESERGIKQVIDRPDAVWGGGGR